MDQILRTVVSDRQLGRTVSMPGHEERGVTYRRITCKMESDVDAEPELPKNNLRNQKQIFSLTTDGLVQGCLEVLMKTFFCREKIVTPTRHVGDDPMYPTNCYTYCSHVISAYLNKHPPYCLIRVKVRTTWLPVHGRDWFKAAYIRNPGGMSYQKAFPTCHSEPEDCIVRRQLQSTNQIHFGII